MVRWLRRIKAAREYRECDGSKKEKHINLDIAGQRFGRRSRLGWIAMALAAAFAAQRRWIWLDAKKTTNSRPNSTQIHPTR